MDLNPGFSWLALSAAARASYASTGRWSAGVARRRAASAALIIAELMGPRGALEPVLESRRSRAAFNKAELKTAERKLKLSLFIVSLN